MRKEVGSVKAESQKILGADAVLAQTPKCSTRNTRFLTHDPRGFSEGYICKRVFVCVCVRFFL